MELQKLQELIDTTAAIEAERLALDRRSKELKKLEDDGKAQIAQVMKENGYITIAGKGERLATLGKSIEPMIADWSLTSEYIRRTGSLDLLQKRLTPTAVKLRWEEGLEVPGIDRYEVLKVTFS